MEVPGPVEPRLRVETRYVSDERIAFPLRHGDSHVGVGGVRIYRVQVNRALGARELEDHHDIVRALDDLKGVRHVHRTRDTRQETEDLRITVQPVDEVLLLPLRRPWLVRDLVAFHHAEVRGHPADRAQGHHRRSQNLHVPVTRYTRVRPWLGHHRTGSMGEQIPIGAVVNLPDATEVGFTVRLARHLRSLRTFGFSGGSRTLTSGPRHRQPKTAGDHGSNDHQPCLSETIPHEKLLILFRYSSTLYILRGAGALTTGCQGRMQ